jgi:hypothetical protein
LLRKRGGLLFVLINTALPLSLPKTRSGMATQSSTKRNRKKEPLYFTVKNASGRDIEAFIPAGYNPTKDPVEKMLKILQHYPPFPPTAIAND